MTDRRIIPRPETISFIRALGAAILTNRPRPSPPEGDFMRADDFEEGVEAFIREVAESLDRVPDRISDDVEVQEVVRHEVDETVSRIVIRMREQFVQLRRRGNQ